MQMCEGTTDICDVAGYLLLPQETTPHTNVEPIK